MRWFSAALPGPSIWAREDPRIVAAYDNTARYDRPNKMGSAKNKPRNNY